jgi:hypothetical protein
MRIFCFTALIVAGVYGFVACSSDTTPEPTGTGGGGNAGSPGGGVVDGGCVDQTQVFNAVDKCLPKAEAVALCKTQAVMAQPGTKTSDPTCGAGCSCEQCAEQMFACANDPEGYCATILKCAQEHNCTGAACYAAATCMGVIDMAPPCDATGKCQSFSSFSVALVQEVSNCVTKTSTFAPGMAKAREGIVCAAACP